MQSAGVSLISAMIPRINTLVRIIDMFMEDATRHPAIRSAALCSLNILNKYYEKSDESFMYWIAMALDPQFKLEYFIKEHWPTDWIDTVKDITCQVYQEDYPSTAMASLPASPRRPLAPSRDWPSLLCGPSAAPLHQERDELMEFWASSIEPPETDPLQFWHGTLVSRPESCLAWMAR